MLEGSTVAAGGDNEESDCYIGNPSNCNHSSHENESQIKPALDEYCFCAVFSPHSSAGREARGEGDAGGDFRTSASHIVGQRLG